MSPDDLYHQLESVLRTRPYYPCVLLVHVDVRRLEGVAQALAARASWAQLAVSETLAATLLDAPVAQRSTLATECLNRPLAMLRPGPVMAYQLTEYARLSPIHSAYIEVLELIDITTSVRHSG